LIYLLGIKVCIAAIRSPDDCAGSVASIFEQFTVAMTQTTQGKKSSPFWNRSTSYPTIGTPR
jgi:hypothetical protein